MVRRIFLVFTLTTCLVPAKGQQLSATAVQPKLPFSPSHSLEETPASVRVSPSRAGTGPAESRAPNSWNIQGYELRTLVGMAYGFDTARVVFTDPRLASRRYDVSVTVPRCEEDEIMRERVRSALRKQLKLAVSEGTAERDVYVVTTPNTPQVRLQRAVGTTTVFSTSSVEIEDDREPSRERMNDLLYRRASEDISLDSISMASGTVDDFCTLLEQGLDRPVLNETHLTGKYDVELSRGKLTREEFFSTIWNRLGLRIARERRTVAMLRVGLE